MYVIRYIISDKINATLLNFCAGKPGKTICEDLSHLQLLPIRGIEQYPITRQYRLANPFTTLLNLTALPFTKVATIFPRIFKCLSGQRSKHHFWCLSLPPPSCFSSQKAWIFHSYFSRNTPFPMLIQSTGWQVSTNALYSMLLALWQFGINATLYQFGDLPCVPDLKVRRGELLFLRQGEKCDWISAKSHLCSRFVGSASENTFLTSFNS